MQNDEDEMSNTTFLLIAVVSLTLYATSVFLGNMWFWFAVENFLPFFVFLPVLFLIVSVFSVIILVLNHYIINKMAKKQ